jgi:serine/threonine protein kinase
LSGLRAGNTIADRYDLVVLLEESGNGQFWRARDRVLNRDVAVNLVPLDDSCAIGLQTAGRTSANLQDPRVARVLDVAEDTQHSYVVSEWVKGLSLDRILAREGPLSGQQASVVVAEVARALAKAHRLDITHGQLIPERVMIDQAGQIKLIGIAVAAAMDGATKGNQKSDTKALAAILYATLTGTWPGEHPSTVPTARRKGKRVIPPRQIRAGVPKELDEICSVVLNGPDSTGRRVFAPYQSPQEVAEALHNGHDTLHSTMSGLIREALAPDLITTSISTTQKSSSDIGLLSDGSEGETTVPWAPGDVKAALAKEFPVAADPGQERQGSMDSDDRPLFANNSERRPRGPLNTTNKPLPAPPRNPRINTGEIKKPLAGSTAGVGFLKLAGVLGIVTSLVTAGVLAFWWNQGSPREKPEPQLTEKDSSPPAAGPLTVVGVADFDPLGDGEEHSSDAVNVTDGDPATSWATFEYFQQFGPGGLIDGLGLILDLGEPRSITKLEISAVGEPHNIQIFVSDQPPITKPTSVVAEKSVGRESVIMLNEPTTGQYVTIWFTEIPAVGDRFQGRLTEITVIG